MDKGGEVEVVMFTGLIEEIGKIKRASPSGHNLRLGIKAPQVSTDLQVGDSVNINGACQTVIDVKDNLFTIEAVEETLSRTNLGQLKPGDSVNLERALRLSDRLGGHLVSGHIDFVGKIRAIIRKDQSYIFEFESPPECRAHFVEKGSVAVDGISLTVVQVLSNSFTVSVIPFTMSHTTLGKRKLESRST